MATNIDNSTFMELTTYQNLSLEPVTSRMVVNPEKTQNKHATNKEKNNK